MLCMGGFSTNLAAGIFLWLYGPYQSRFTKGVTRLEPAECYTGLQKKLERHSVLNM